MDIIDKLCNTLEYMDKSKDFNESASVIHIVEAIDMITELRAQLTNPQPTSPDNESKSALKRHAVQNSSENDADKMREAFEVWRKNEFKQRYVFNEDGAGFPDHEQDEVYEAWQAATAKQAMKEYLQ